MKEERIDEPEISIDTLFAKRPEPRSDEKMEPEHERKQNQSRRKRKESRLLLRRRKKKTSKL